MNLRAILLTGLLPGLVLSACGGEPVSTPDPGAGAPAPSAAPAIGSPAPAWSGRLLDGETFDLAALRGEVVVLNVWATWCAPCLREMPALDALQREYADAGLRVIGASIDRGSAEPDVREFVAELSLSFEITLDPDQTVMDRFRVIGVPETFLIDRDGIIVHRWIGEFDPHAEDERARIEAVL